MTCPRPHLDLPPAAPITQAYHALCPYIGTVESLTDSHGYTGNPAECGPLIQPVFGCDMRTDLQGTLFRLPLRLPEHASECPYAPHAIPVSRARELMLDFVRQLQDGKIMLFLENVCEVEIWQWEEDKDAPDMLARQTRRLLTGSAPSRLPPKLLPYATTFEELHGHISGMSSEDVEQIGSPVLSTVRANWPSRPSWGKHSTACRI